PRSQRVRAGKLGQNAVPWSAFVPLRAGTGRAPALGRHAREEAPIPVAATAAEKLAPPHVGCYRPRAFNRLVKCPGQAFRQLSDFGITPSGLSRRRPLGGVDEDLPDLGSEIIVI